MGGRLSPLSETGLHAINVDRSFDRAVPLSFETRFLRIVGVALDAQPVRWVARGLERTRGRREGCSVLWCFRAVVRVL